MHRLDWLNLKYKMYTIFTDKNSIFNNKEVLVFKITYNYATESPHIMKTIYELRTQKPSQLNTVSCPKGTPVKIFAFLEIP